MTKNVRILKTKTKRLKHGLQFPSKWGRRQVKLTIKFRNVSFSCFLIACVASAVVAIMQ